LGRPLVGRISVMCHGTSFSQERVPLVLQSGIFSPTEDHSVTLSIIPYSTVLGITLLTRVCMVTQKLLEGYKSMYGTWFLFMDHIHAEKSNVCHNVITPASPHKQSLTICFLSRRNWCGCATEHWWHHPWSCELVEPSLLRAEVDWTHLATWFNTLKSPHTEIGHMDSW
jgi:hypothetical protein